MIETILLIAVAFFVLCVAGWIVGGAATIGGNIWRSIDPRELQRQERIRSYRERHPNEPIYKTWRGWDD